MEHRWWKQKLIWELRRVTDRFGQLPDRDTMKMYGNYPPARYDQVFESFSHAVASIKNPNVPVDETASEEALIEELKRLEFATPRKLQKQDLFEGEYPVEDYEEVFGSIEQAFLQAGILDREEEFSDKYSDQEVIADIQRVAFNLDEDLTLTSYLQFGEYSYSVLRNKWGVWENVLEAAGIDSPESTLTKTEIVDDIQRVGNTVGKRPTRDEYHEKGLYSLRKINEGVGWVPALALAGYSLPNRGRKIEEEDLEMNLRQVRNELGRKPTREDIRETGAYSEKPYQRVYGSVEEAVEEVLSE